jgi:hypothetical protein
MPCSKHPLPATRPPQPLRLPQEEEEEEEEEENKKKRMKVAPVAVRAQPLTRRPLILATGCEAGFGL